MTESTFISELLVQVISIDCQCDNQAEMSAEIGLGVTTLKLSNPQKEIRSGNSHHISTFKFLGGKKLVSLVQSPQMA